MAKDVHVTERSLFKECRRHWKYQYRDHLYPAQESRGALWFGRGLHFALAEFYRGNDPYAGLDEWMSRKFTPSELAEMWPDERAQLDETLGLIRSILDGYIPWAALNDTEWEIVDVERSYRVRVPGTYCYLVGTLDLVIRNRVTRKLWVVDHKSTSQGFADPYVLELDDQMTAYLWLLWQTYGELPAGAIYNQFRKKKPAEPYLVKDGSRLSKDKSIDTTYEMYLAAIEQHGFDVADYSDILVQLRNNEFYKRELIARNKNELVNFTSQLQLELRELTSKSVPIYPHATRDCSWGCSFRILCKAENEGGDVDSLKQANYIIVDGRVD